MHVFKRIKKQLVDIAIKSDSKLPFSFYWRDGVNALLHSRKSQKRFSPLYSPLKTIILKTMGNTYVNPFNDFFIRFLLGSEGNEDLCRSFINTVLDDADFPPVSKVTIKNPFNLKEALNAKESVTDVKVETGEGHVFDVEVQTGKLAAFEKRTLFYWSKMYTSQISEGEGYELYIP